MHFHWRHVDFGLGLVLDSIVEVEEEDEGESKDKDVDENKEGFI